MTRHAPLPARTDDVGAHMSAALRVSRQSVIWTLVSSTVAVVLGLQGHIAVLLAFGAVGYVDAVGSMALTHHFGHGLRTDELSDELELLAHRIVLLGLFLVGWAAIVAGLTRIRGSDAGEGSFASVALAAASLGALVALSSRKQRVARRIGSNALRSDGHLSAIGAMQAGVTLVGLAAAQWLDWRWADGSATAIIGGVAVALAVGTWRREHRPQARG
jgi:divalent metal cation (Fe/Co/Zn/Cd) transporter